MTRIISRVTEMLIKNKIVCEEEREIYEYCVGCVLEISFMWMTKNNKKNTTLKAFARLCLWAGRLDVNGVCRGFFHQPIVTESI